MMMWWWRRRKKVDVDVCWCCWLWVAAFGLSVEATATATSTLSVTITRHHLGDIFSTAECGEAACVGVSSGTATPTDKCSCRCLHHLPVFRDDLQICVEDIRECALAPFVSGTTRQKIPYVFLPLKGQIVYPSAEISFAEAKSPICVVSGAKFLTRGGWVDLRNRSDTEPPFRLFRDEGRTFLQWLGPPDLRISMEGRLLVVDLMCKDMAADTTAHSSIFTPCVAFRVAGTPSVREVSFSADAHATEHANTTTGLSASEYIAIGICSVLLGLMYIASVLLYLHTRRQHSKNNADRHKDDLQSGGQLVEEGIVKNNPLLRHCHDNGGYITDSGPPSCCSDTDDGCSEDNHHDVSDDNSISKPTQKITAAQIHPHHVKEIYTTSECSSTQLQDTSAIERLPEENVSIVETLEGREERPETVRAITMASTRRKLYFNPAYFELELLLAPPPAALEFLSKIREVIAIAKHKMAAKKFFPSLLGIPEEIENSNQQHSHRHHHHQNRHSHQGSVRSSVKTHRSERERNYNRFALQQQTPIITCDGCPGCTFQPNLQSYIMVDTEKECKTCCSTTSESKQRSIRKWLEDVPLIKPEEHSSQEPEEQQQITQQQQQQPEKIIKVPPPRRNYIHKGKAPSIPTAQNIDTINTKQLITTQQQIISNESSSSSSSSSSSTSSSFFVNNNNNILSTFTVTPLPSMKLENNTTNDETNTLCLPQINNTIINNENNSVSSSNNSVKNNKSKLLPVNNNNNSRNLVNENLMNTSIKDIPEEMITTKQQQQRSSNLNSNNNNNNNNNNNRRENKIKSPPMPPPPPPPPPSISSTVDTNKNSPPPKLKNNISSTIATHNNISTCTTTSNDNVVLPKVAKKLMDAVIKEFVGQTKQENNNNNNNNNSLLNKPNPPLRTDSLNNTNDENNKTNNTINNEYDTDSLERTLKEYKDKNGENGLSTPSDYGEVKQKPLSTINHNITLPLDEEMTIQNAIFNKNTGNMTLSKLNKNNNNIINKNEIEDDHEYEIILLNPEPEKDNIVNNNNMNMNMNNNKLALPDILNRGEGYSLVSEVYVNDNFSYGSSSLPSSSSSCSSSSHTEQKISYEKEKPGRLTIQVESPTYQQEDSDSFEPDTLDRKPSKLKISETNCHHFSDIDLNRNSDFFVDSLERPAQISLKTTGSFRSESANWCNNNSELSNIFKMSPLNRTFGSLREIFEARTKYNSHGCNRSEGFSPVGSTNSLHSDTDCYSTLSWERERPKILRPEAREARRQRQPSPDARPPRPPKLKKQHEYRNISLKPPPRIDVLSPPLPPRTIKPPLPPKNGSVRNISQRSEPANRPLPKLPPHSKSLTRRTLTNGSGGSPPISSEYETIDDIPYDPPRKAEAQRTLRDSKINHKHMIFRSTNRTEDSGYLSTDSNGSDGQKTKPDESLSETDDSLCDGASESGAESIATDSFFFGNNIPKLTLAKSVENGLGGSTHSDTDSNVSFITVLPNAFNRHNEILIVP